MIIIAINKQLIIIQLPVNCGWKVWYDLRTSYAVSIETVTPSRQCRQQLNVNNLKLNGTEWKTLVFHLTICIVENVSARKLMKKAVLNGNLERFMETGKHRWHQYSRVFRNWCEGYNNVRVCNVDGLSWYPAINIVFVQCFNLIENNCPFSTQIIDIKAVLFFFVIRRLYGIALKFLMECCCVWW